MAGSLQTRVAREGPGLANPQGLDSGHRLCSSACWSPPQSPRVCVVSSWAVLGTVGGTAASGSMGFEELLDQVGGFGPFQWRTLVLMALPRVLLPLHFLLPVFLAAVPSHHCALPGIPANISHQDLWLEAHLPREPDGTFSSCFHFTQPRAPLNTTLVREAQSPGELEDTASTVPCPQGWEYDSSEFSSTIATEVPMPRG